jgi:hypothetical protein
LVCAAILPAYGQTSSSKFQPGTITAVTAHQNAAGESASAGARYDVSVKVGNTIYTVLYAPPNGANGVEYSTGFELLVSVASDTLTFNSKLSGTTVTRWKNATCEKMDLATVPIFVPLLSPKILAWESLSIASGLAVPSDLESERSFFGS